MHRYSLAAPVLLAVLAAFAVDVPPAHAEARPVTANFDTTKLRSYFNSVGEVAVNVGSGQVADAQRWRTTSSGNSAMTLMFTMAADAAGNALGVYNAGFVAPATLFEIFPATAVAGQYAMASFKSAPPRLVVTLFTTDGDIASGPVSMPGISLDNFAYYIRGVAGTGYSQDALNAGDSARMLAYGGTGRNLGNWWLCFEDGDPQEAGEGRDFDDAIVFVESINPTPVSRTSWGALKSRFR